MGFGKDNLEPGNGDVYRTDGTVCNTADIIEDSLGGKGLEIISDTAAHIPPAWQCFKAINIMTDTIIAAHLEDSGAPVTGTLTGVSFTAGVWIFGKFTSIELTSGALIAYLGAI
jgi:flavodoxin